MAVGSAPEGRFQCHGCWTATDYVIRVDDDLVPCCGQLLCEQAVKAHTSRWPQPNPALPDHTPLPAPVPQATNHTLRLHVTLPVYGRPDQDKRTAQAALSALKLSLHSEVGVQIVTAWDTLKVEDVDLDDYNRGEVG